MEKHMLQQPNTASLRKAKEDHAKFLDSFGITKLSRDKRVSVVEFPDLTTRKPKASTSNTIPGGTIINNSIFDFVWKKEKRRAATL